MRGIVRPDGATLWKKYKGVFIMKKNKCKQDHENHEQDHEQDQNHENKHKRHDRKRKSQKHILHIPSSNGQDYITAWAKCNPLAQNLAG